jgi:predicted helicase
MQEISERVLCIINPHLKWLKRATSFNEIYEYTKNMGNTEKGELFEVITYFYFMLSELNKKVDKIWLYKEDSEELHKIKNYLNLPENDVGFDLIYKERKYYIGVQCKYSQDPSRIISWKDLSTFTGLIPASNKIKYGVLVTNTTKITEIVKNMEKIECINGENFEDKNLPINFFKNIYNLCKKKEIETLKKHLYEYQKDCVKLCVDKYNSGDDRITIIMPHMTGKTLISYCINKKMRSEITLILVSSIEIIKHFYLEWYNQSKNENLDPHFILINIGIIKLNVLRHNNLSLISPDDKMKDKICEILRTRDNVVIITSYNCINLMLECLSRVDLCICDESMLLTNKYQLLGKFTNDSSKILYNKHIKIGKRLFLTTYQNNYSTEYDIPLKKIISMDNERYFGEVAYSYSYSDMIKNGYLSNIKLVVPSITSDTLKDIYLSQRYITLEHIKNENGKIIIFILVLLKDIVEDKIDHILIYHTSKEESVSFMNLLIDMNEMFYKKDIYIGNIISNQDEYKNNGKITNYNKSSKGVLCINDILLNDLTMQKTNAIVFMDGVVEIYYIIKMIGKTLISYENNKITYVYVPLMISNYKYDYNYDIYINIFRSLMIMKTLKSALKINNELLDESDKQKYASKKRIKNIKKEYGDDYLDRKYYPECEDDNLQDNENSLTKKNLMRDSKLMEEINLNDISSKTYSIKDNFNMMYDKLYEWTNIRRKLPLIKTENEEERMLGYWVRFIMSMKDYLDDDKIDKIEKIKYWYWSISEKTEVDIYCIKKWYKDKNIHPKKTSNDVFECDVASYIFDLQKKYKDSKLNDNHIKKLEKIDGFYFDVDHLIKYVTIQELERWMLKKMRNPLLTSENIKERKMAYYKRSCDKNDVFIITKKLSDKKKEIKRLENIKKKKESEKKLEKEIDKKVNKLLKKKKKKKK